MDTTRTPEENDERLLTIYVADEVLVRARNMARNFGFLMEEADFREAMNGFSSSYDNPPENIEDLRALHEKLISTLKKKEGGDGVATISAIRPEGTTMPTCEFQIPEDILDFDEIVERVREEIEYENVENSLESATDSVILGEAKLTEIMTRHLFTVRGMVMEKIYDMFPGDEGEVKPMSAEVEGEYTSDDDEEEESDPSAETLVGKIGEKKFVRLLELSDEELEANHAGIDKGIVDLILQTREIIREDAGADGKSEKIRANDVSRIFYDEPNDDILEALPGMTMEQVEKRLGTLKNIEEAAIRMAHGITGEENDLTFVDETDMFREYGEWLEHKQAEALKRNCDEGIAELPTKSADDLPAVEEDEE